MARKASNFTAEDLVLIEVTANKDQRPGDTRVFKDKFIVVQTSVEFGIQEMSVHHTGTEAVVTGQFVITESVSIDEESDDDTSRENKVSCTYRVILCRDTEEDPDFDVSELDPDEFVDIALSYAYPYFRQKLQLLTRDVFVSEHEMLPTWKATKERLDLEVSERSG